MESKSNQNRIGRVARLISLALLSFLAVASSLKAQRIPEQFDKSTVAFVFLSDEKGDPVRSYGTCFFVASPPSPDGRAIYMVTAGHVLKDEHENVLPQVLVRLQSKTGGLQFVNVPLTLTNTPFKAYFHPEPGVDLAIVPLSNKITSRCQISWIEQTYIATKEVVQKQRVREGDEMFFMGLYTHFFGAKSNVPIVRFGRLAMLTEEKIKVFSNQPPQDFYLMETQAFGGNSGSPALFSFNQLRNPNDVSLLLAGVIQAHSLNPAEIVKINADTNRFALENAGIAYVVPAYRILELINSDEQKKIRGF